MPRKKIKREVEIDLTIEECADWFASITDDDQARFFVAVARIAAETYSSRPEAQWLAIGNHLATCECSSAEGRDMIESIKYGMDNPWTKPPVDLRMKAQAVTAE